MKVFATLCLLFFSIAITFGQKTEIENKIGNIKLKQLKGSVPVKYDFVKQTGGKITIIEFWETWCVPCIEGMGHLRALKKKFPDSLEIICVSSDRLDKTVEFIAKNDFPFTFLYDKERSLSKIFPHEALPHTILVDKKGKIEAETYVGFVTEEVLTKLGNDNGGHLPAKKNFTAAELRTESKANSLIKFELSRHQLGDRNYIEETSKKDIPVQIVTGYSGKDYHDTVETIRECLIAGKNALNIYQYAYDKVPLSRFIYDEDLNYLKSSLPNFQFKMKFSCSNLMGDFKEILIHQLNSVWGLQTKMIEKECSYYELVRIDLKHDTIMTEPASTIKITRSTSQSFKQLTTSNVYTAESIAALIENQIVHLQSNKFWNEEHKKIYFPVTTKLIGNYALNISINDESSDVNNWIELLAKTGLSLVKKSGKIKYIQIEKAAHNRL